MGAFLRRIGAFPGSLLRAHEIEETKPLRYSWPVRSGWVPALFFALTLF